MNRWRSSLLDVEDKVESFKSRWLESADYSSVGITADLASAGKRYNNYEKIYMNLDVKFDPLIYYVSSERTEENMERAFFALFKNEITKRKKMEEWDLSYSQITFESRREEAESEVIRLFCAVEKVLKIYSSQYDESAVHFQILTSNNKYDRDLMMKMLDLEYELGHNYKDIALSFDYIPKVYDYEKDIVVKYSKCIYKKNIGFKNEFITSALTASAPQQTTSEVFIPISPSF